MIEYACIPGVDQHYPQHYPQSHPQTLLPRVRYWKQSTLGLFGSGNETRPASVQKWWKTWCLDIVRVISAVILLLSRGCCRYDNEVGLPQCSFQIVPVSVIASTIERLHSCHIIMWLSLAVKVSWALWGLKYLVLLDLYAMFKMLN